jgi:enoyl-CoA hydratase/carnithine racemase
MKSLNLKKIENIGVITLNRPEALNALTYDMIKTIEETLDLWLQEKIDFIIIEAIGKKAFCAGGDITDLYENGCIKNFQYSRKFWSDEYRLNTKLAMYPKPIISFLQGFTMGGGVGLGCHVRHRLVSETSKIAMPECGIGLVPDVGGSYILAKTTFGLGEYLATTGYRMNADDAILAGFADHFIPEKDWRNLKDRLIKTKTLSILDSYSKKPVVGELRKNLSKIESIFSKHSLLDILDALNKDNTVFSKESIKSIEKNSPLSVLSTFDIIRKLRELEDLSIQTSLDYEYRFTSRALEFSDFLEGIRAQVIDKDRSPKWQHKHIRDVPRKKVEQMLEPLD